MLLFSGIMSSLTLKPCFPPRPKMSLTYVVHVCCDISLTQGHLGSMGGISKINLNTRN